ncbi:MAG: PspC domain-containing protein [Acidobacteriota bacterium]|nr:PspC domain-containing protein [Acidobacteriota bacterium]
MNPDARFCSHCGRPMQARAWGHYGDRLTRPRYGRMIGGVCAGFAEHYDWSPVLVRLLTVLLFFFTHGLMLLLYIAAWIVMPNEPYFYVASPPPPSYPPSYPPNTAGSAAGSTPVA